MQNLYDANGCLQADACAREYLGVDGPTLMHRAAQAALDDVVQYYPQAQGLSVWCGKGNNAGDGLLLAARAAELGMAVQVVAL